MVEGTAKFCSVDHCNLFSILYACNLQYFRILRVRNFQKNQFAVNLKAPKCSESVELQGSRKEVTVFVCITTFFQRLKFSVPFCN